ncbi:MAG: hypothetical protein NUV52_02040 [Candidatus Roizmanbacteria bacterium]|nr:hypothetical protein [Candidatus Roizmanbacteria bacterium]
MNITTHINAIIMGIVIIIVISMLLQRVDTYLRMTGIHDCQTIARYEKTVAEDDNAKISYPLPDQYEKCVKQKGL